jgi:hypothetical protein
MTEVVTPAPAANGVATLDAWTKAKRHTITRPSGTKVEVEIPDLPALVKTGTIPNELVDVAIGVVQGKQEITREDIVKQADFYNKLVAMTVISPSITEEQVTAGAIPFEDKELIVEIATRQRDIDAIGHHISGLERVKEWRTFRGVDHVYESVEG